MENKENNKEPEINQENDGLVLYELGLNLVPTITEDGLDKEYSKIKDTIISFGSKISTESSPVVINLAYTMVKNTESKNKKYDSAYFGWIKFNTEPENIEKIKHDLDLNDSILRYMIIKATNEGDILSEEVARMINKTEGDDPEDKKKTTKKEKSEDGNETEESEDDSKIQEGEESEDDSRAKEKEDDKKMDNEEVDKAIDELVV